MYPGADRAHRQFARKPPRLHARHGRGRYSRLGEFRKARRASLSKKRSSLVLLAVEWRWAIDNLRYETADIASLYPTFHITVETITFLLMSPLRHTLKVRVRHRFIEALEVSRRYDESFLKFERPLKDPHARRQGRRPRGTTQV